MALGFSWLASIFSWYTLMTALISSQPAFIWPSSAMASTYSSPEPSLASPPFFSTNVYDDAYLFLPGPQVTLQLFQMIHNQLPHQVCFHNPTIHDP
jgi:phage terminase large subunit-like protein